MAPATPRTFEALDRFFEVVEAAVAGGVEAGAFRDAFRLLEVRAAEAFFEDDFFADGFFDAALAGADFLDAGLFEGDFPEDDFFALPARFLPLVFLELAAM